MPQTVKLSDDLVNQVRKHAKVFDRSVPKQIEHWAKIGKLVEEDPDLSYNFIIKGKLGNEEAKDGEFGEGYVLPSQ